MKKLKQLSQTNMIQIIKKITFVLLCIISIISISSCKRKENEDPNNPNDPSIPDLPVDQVYQNKYSTSSRVGYETEYLGTVKRNIPEDYKNEGLSTVGYPKYGYTLREAIGTTEDKVAIRNAIIEESSYLTTKNTWNGGGGGYNRFDSEGNLYLNDEPVLDQAGVQRKLYKHTASEGMYYGDVSDEELGIIKRITMTPRGYGRGYGLTGLYAPAGEIVKLEISAEDMEATGGITVYIGQALFNGKANNIWTDKNAMNRFPVILNTLIVNKDTAEYDEEKKIYTAYLGSFVGGPIYIVNESVTFTTTISGAVPYSHFILGYTTPEEFEQNRKSSAPYFDLEVWEFGVLHSGPRMYADPFSYDDLYDAAILWDKIALVSTQVSSQGIVFLYDPFVAAGAAVAFPGQGSVNCPAGWMPGSLNYKAFVNGGAWGNMHEYNHNFQGWGLGNGGEVTNNALNLVSYSLFTKISSNRRIGSINEGMGGWNAYTNPSWATRDVTEGRYSNGTYGLSVYATLLHAFGQEVFMKSVKTSGGQSVDRWFNATMNASKQDMTYFYKDLIGHTVSDATLLEAQSKDYPMFVPVASIYQTGRSFTMDGQKNYSSTAQPYVIPQGEDFDIDLNRCLFDSGNIYQGGSIVLPQGFSYTIKNVSQPEHGKITKLDNNMYRFTPDSNNRSGKIYVTIGITKDDRAFEVDDVELVFEFEQSYEMNKNVLERTTYTYDEDKMYSDSVLAFESNYVGYRDKVEGDNQNPILNGKVVQNCNSEVWFVDKPIGNQIVEIKGKIHAEETGKYRIALRGRWNCALFVSLDEGKTYELAAKYVQTKTFNSNFPNTEGTYKDYEFDSEKWVYFKAVLITGNDGARSSFIGVGWGKFTPPSPVLDDDGNEVGLLPESVKVGYIDAIRQSYVSKPQDFQSEYFYKRSYKYSYNDNQKKDLKNQKVISVANYSPWSATDHPIENLVDGNFNTWIHTNYTASENKPLIITVDMGEKITANRIILYTQSRSDPHYPSTFTLYGSLDGEEYFEISKFENTKLSGNKITLDFNETSFRYYRLNITKSSTQYIILSEIEFMKIFEINNGNMLTLDNEKVTLKGSWAPKTTLSTFGHIYVGKEWASMEFEFEGTRFGILSSSQFKQDFEVYIDDMKVDSIPLKEDNGVVMSYISSELSSGRHKVVVKCTGDANIDSIVYWD